MRFPVSTTNELYNTFGQIVYASDRNSSYQETINEAIQKDIPLDSIKIDGGEKGVKLDFSEKTVSMKHAEIHNAEISFSNHLDMSFSETSNINVVGNGVPNLVAFASKNDKFVLNGIYGQIDLNGSRNSASQIANVDANSIDLSQSSNNNLLIENVRSNEVSFNNSSSNELEIKTSHLNSVSLINTNFLSPASIEESNIETVLLPDGDKEKIYANILGKGNNPDFQQEIKPVEAANSAYGESESFVLPELDFSSLEEGIEISFLESSDEEGLKKSDADFKEYHDEKDAGKSNNAEVIESPPKPESESRNSASDGSSITLYGENSNIIYRSDTAKDFSEALTEANGLDISLDGLIVQGKIISNADLKGKGMLIENSIIKGNSETEIKLENSKLSSVRLSNVNITTLEKSIVNDVVIEDSNMSNIQSEGTSYSKVSIENFNVPSVTVDAKMKGAVLSEYEDSVTGFSGGDMRGVKINDSKIAGFDNVDLRGAEISDSRIGGLEDCDARNSTFNNVLIFSSVNGTDFSGSNAMSDEVTKSSIKECTNKGTIFKTVIADEMEEFSQSTASQQDPSF